MEHAKRLVSTMIHRHGRFQPIGAKSRVDDIEMGHQGVARSGVEPLQTHGFTPDGRNIVTHCEQTPYVSDECVPI